MKPCLWTDFLIDVEPDEAVRRIGAAGFGMVEFGLTHEKRFLEGTSEAEEERRLERINAAARAAGVEIAQMHGHLFNLCELEASEVEAHVQWAHRSLRRAERLGVKWVVLHPGSTSKVAADPQVLEQVKERNLEFFQDLLVTAREVDVGIAIENMAAFAPRFGATVGDLLWLVEQLNSDRVGICWDTGHAHITGIDQPLALRAIGDRLVALHIADNDRQADRHWAPYRGSIEWEPILAALREINYQGPFNLELPGEAKAVPARALDAKMRFLRELCECMVGDQAVSEPAFAN